MQHFSNRFCHDYALYSTAVVQALGGKWICAANQETSSERKSLELSSSISFPSVGTCGFAIALLCSKRLIPLCDRQARSLFTLSHLLHICLTRAGCSYFGDIKTSSAGSSAQTPSGPRASTNLKCRKQSPTTQSLKEKLLFCSDTMKADLSTSFTLQPAQRRYLPKVVQPFLKSWQVRHVSWEATSLQKFFVL